MVGLVLGNPAAGQERDSMTALSRQLGVPGECRSPLRFRPALEATLCLKGSLVQTATDGAERLIGVSATASIGLIFYSAPPRVFMAVCHP